MALIKCPECNKEISETAKKCVHCGYKVKRKNNLISYLVPLMIITSVAVYGFFITTNLLNEHVYKQAIESKYGNEVISGCTKYKKIQGSNNILYTCKVRTDYFQELICLKCNNNQFLFYTRLSECKIISDYQCSSFNLYN